MSQKEEQEWIPVSVKLRGLIRRLDVQDTIIPQMTLQLLVFQSASQGPEI